MVTMLQVWRRPLFSLTSHPDHFDARNMFTAGFVDPREEAETTYFLGLADCNCNAYMRQRADKTGSKALAKPSKRSLEDTHSEDTKISRKKPRIHEVGELDSSVKESSGPASAHSVKEASFSLDRTLVEGDSNPSISRGPSVSKDAKAARAFLLPKRPSVKFTPDCVVRFYPNRSPDVQQKGDNSVTDWIYKPRPPKPGRSETFPLNPPPQVPKDKVNEQTPEPNLAAVHSEFWRQIRAEHTEGEELVLSIDDLLKAKNPLANAKLFTPGGSHSRRVFTCQWKEKEDVRPATI